jgi:hypothetical protein
MLRYASGTIRGTALTPGSARRVMARTVGAAASWRGSGSLRPRRAERPGKA